MYPECLTVKLFQNAQYLAQNGPHTSSSFNQYNETIRLIPYRPFMNFPNVATFSSVNSLPLGIDRFLGIATPAMYKECIVISVAYDVQLDFSPALGAINAQGASYAWQPLRHMLHPYDTVGGALTSPTTQVCNVSASGLIGSWLQVLSDQFANQPDVKVVRTLGTTAGNPASAAETNVSSMGPVRAQRVRWTGVIWPHKIQEIPFETYLGDKANYSTGAAGATIPTQYTGLQFAGATPRPDDVPNIANSPYHGTWTIRLAWSLMFKTPVDDQA